MAIRETTPLEPLSPVAAGPRRGERWATDGRAQLVSRHQDVPLSVPIRDLSSFGVGVAASFGLAVGDEVVVCFEPPGGRELMVFGEVRRLRGEAIFEGLGIEFLDITADERVMVDEALAAVSPRPRAS